MIVERPSELRGYSDFGWLQAKYTFSFARYYDPRQSGFGNLLVMNEDRIAAGLGFPMHSHESMEIITYVIKGTLEHQDSMGNKGQICAGEFQYMSAGTGVTHSEANPDPKTELHLYQIWIQPKSPGMEPRYRQKYVAPRSPTVGVDNFLIATGNDARAQAEDAIHIRQDMEFRLMRGQPGQHLEWKTTHSRNIWIQAVSGEIQLKADHDTLRLRAGDGAACTKVGEFAIEFLEPSEIFVFDGS